MAVRKPKQPEVKDLTAIADAAAAESTINEVEGEDSEGEMNFPAQPSALKNTPHEERLKIWARQEKAGVIQLCKAKQGALRCYFPVIAVRDPSKSMDPKVVEVDGVKCVEGKCSFDPEGHGPQYIYPPKKEDEI